MMSSLLRGNLTGAAKLFVALRLVLEIIIFHLEELSFLPFNSSVFGVFQAHVED